MNKKSKFINYKTYKTSGFTIPSLYFENFEDVIMSKINPKKLPEKEGFKIPNNYFKNLENRLLKSVTILENKQTKTAFISKKIRTLAPFIAAASILLFIGFYFLSNNNSQKINLNDITDSEIIAWFSNDYETIDDVSYENLLTNNSTEEFSILSSNLISSNEIEDYLNSIETIYLLNEF